MARRFGVSKHGSARKFRNHIQHTKVANMRTVMRGGWRL